MNKPENNILFWSGGKDSCMALHELVVSRKIKPILLTTFNQNTNILPFQGISIDLIKKQADSLDLDLIAVPLPENCSNNDYKRILEEHLSVYTNLRLFFGDIFIEDIRKFREEVFIDIAQEIHFPIWNTSTDLLSKKFVELGYKAVISGIDITKLDSQVLGSNYDEKFISHLSDDIDKCGENGEFHTFVYRGPLFKKEIPFIKSKSELLFDRYKMLILE